MKLNQKFLLSLFLGLFCCLLLPTKGAADLPPYTPPINPEEAVSVLKSSRSVEVIFHENADDVLVEVFTEKGQLIYQEKGIANAQTQLRIDAQSWKGSYVIRVSLDNAEKFFNVYFQ